MIFDSCVTTNAHLETRTSNRDDRMATRFVWQQIKEQLTDDIHADRYPVGQRLPTEAQLAIRFAVNRHTVRRALAELSAEGLIRVRQGAGAKVMQPRLSYNVGQHTRFTDNVAGLQRKGEKRIIVSETRPAEPHIARTLNLRAGASVHQIETLAEIDGQPFAYTRSSFPAARVSGLRAAFADTLSVTASLQACGVPGYRRLWTEVTADWVEGAIARHLGGSASGDSTTLGRVHVLHTIALNIEDTVSEQRDKGKPGAAIEYCEAFFRADLATLRIEH